MRIFVLASFVASFAFASSTALADEPDPPAPPAPAPPHADPTCAVERFVGVTKEEAEAVEEIVCPEIHEQLPYGGRHRIRIARLGGKVVLTLVSEREGGGPRAEKQLVLSGLDEVPVAAPRLVEALVDRKPIAETQTVTNIVGQEARVPKKKASEIHGWLGMVAVGAPGAGTGGGAHLGLSAGSDRWSFVGDLRLAGQAFAVPASVAITIFSLSLLKPEPKGDFAYVSLSGGVRHHFAPTDTSPFFGAGVALVYLGADPKGYDESENTGVAGYGEIGLDLMRTHSIGGTIALRFDAPAFTLEQTKQSGSWGYGQQPVIQRTTSWVPILGATFSLRF